jgi:glyoxylase-like metal-dependent hydrolase (beta-lactamase superfamily II)
MHIDTFVLGDFLTNCYVVRVDESRKDCVLIDPGLHPYPLVQFLKQQTLNPEAVIITHGHIDHIGGVEIIREHWPKTKVYIHKADAEMLTDPNENLSMVAGTVFQARPAEVVITVRLKFEPRDCGLKSCTHRATPPAAFACIARQTVSLLWAIRCLQGR